MRILFSLYVYLQEVYFYIHDSITRIYHGLVYLITNHSKDGVCYVFMHPKTTHIQLSNIMPSTLSLPHILSISHIGDITTIRVNSLFRPMDTNIRHHQVSRCFLSSILTMNGSVYEIDLRDFYYSGNEILSSMFILYYLYKRHLITTIDFSYTIECMDNDLHMITLTSDNYVQVGKDSQYSIMTIQS
jgi:hypothetical protein